MPDTIAWEMGPCPDCNGTGSDGTACRRCAGTGKVRHYADGFVGNEHTRQHRSEEAIEPVTDPSTLLRGVPKPGVL